MSFKFSNPNICSYFSYQFGVSDDEIEEAG
jgi:hypothetical protein